MVHAADPSHPRYESLLKRAMLEEAQRKGMLANSAMIAHGRGEAFDYLIGEQTTESAEMATREAAARLVSANSCIISVNGNVAALASEEILKCASILECDIEVNIFYRTPERMQAILRHVETCKVNLLEMDNIGLSEGWKERLPNVRILGSSPDVKIPGLEGPRANCHSDGIMSVDTILVPLEDGDRCEALVAMGKEVIVVDLNPLSRSAQRATVTIVDELTRFISNLIQILSNDVASPNLDWDNGENLRCALNDMHVK